MLRADLNIQSLPSPIPSFGGLIGANTILTDSRYSDVKISRVTDGATFKNYDSGQTADHADSCFWNTDDTMLIGATTGGMYQLFQFNPATMQASIMVGQKYEKAKFSSVNPGVLFVANGTQVSQVNFALVSGVWTYQSESLICDFADILPVGYVPEWAGVFAHSITDSTFTLAFSESTQDTGNYICVYRVGKGYRMLNTFTGEITGTGSWGAIGTANGVVFASDNYIHDALQTQSDDYVSLSVLNTSSPDCPIIWEIDSLNVMQGIVTGHKAWGVTHYYGSGPGGGQYAEVPYKNPTTRENVCADNQLPKGQTPPQVYNGGDQHAAFGLGQAIFWASSQSRDASPTSAWWNEILGYTATGSKRGTVYRACQTLNSGLSKQFIVNNAVASPSQTGKFVMFCSDCYGQLGSLSGAATGTPGIDARGDVFVVQVAE